MSIFEVYVSSNADFTFISMYDKIIYFSGMGGKRALADVAPTVVCRAKDVFLSIGWDGDYTDSLACA